MPDTSRRFDRRVDEYRRFRPGYPQALCDRLVGDAGLSPASVVADVGSGTGLSTDLFLRLGCEVYAVEPNAEMRDAAEARLSANDRFHSVAGSAEATTLREASVDWVVAGQASHWFEPERAHREFARILRPAGRVALFWNTRHETGSPFLDAFEQMLRTHAIDYLAVKHTNAVPRLLAQLFANRHQRREFRHAQRLNLAALRGLLLSTSYTPAAGDPRQLAMLREIERIFSVHNDAGEVRIEYDTELYFGALVRQEGPPRDDGETRGGPGPARKERDTPG